MMGACLKPCKETEEARLQVVEQGPNERQRVGGRESTATTGTGPSSSKTLAETVDKLVNETLDVVGRITENEREPPNSIIMLHVITENPVGWIELVRSLVRVVPVEHPMGPSVIALLLDDSPLPTRHSVLKVADMITQSLRRNPRKERNLCVVLGCLAEKLAGPSSIALLHEATIKYLLDNLRDDVNTNVKLLSLIALEKFAQTSENKATIKRTLATLEENPLARLERHATSGDHLLRQIGFCARWCLDNYFLIEGRQFAYETMDLSGITAMLNVHDASEYLKISPDGLEARCDAYTFESARCTFQVNHGCWYYEVEVMTRGVMQIGWATKESNFLSDDGYGIGDDKHSIGFDGCRRLVWHNAKSVPHDLPTWRSGSILGCLLDLEQQEVIFSLDGVETMPYRHVLYGVKEGYFAAASFMSFQHCRFNFGLQPFRHPPRRPYEAFNQHGALTPQDKIVLPRHIYLELLRKVSVHDDSCTLCFDRKAIIRLEPCQHRGFCSLCVLQLTFCPMCRAEIKERLEEHEPTAADDSPTSGCRTPSPIMTLSAAPPANLSPETAAQGLSKSPAVARTTTATAPPTGKTA